MFINTISIASHLDEDGNIKAGEEDDVLVPALFQMAGLITTLVAVPLWISGSVKANNNKKAMNKCTPQKYSSLNIGVSPNGVGLVYRF
ncbi:MAG: hypothetical protein B7C24_02745 [Bacteroidetes bacterium 4572_77]|nr:MAG: hypothetical protein B7C24_02745 [Bacteroidetes bacterium 4572_77]